MNRSTTTYIGDSGIVTLPPAVHNEVDRLLAFYRSDESDQDDCTTLSLTAIDVRPATHDEAAAAGMESNSPRFEYCFRIATECVEILKDGETDGGPATAHDDVEILTESGRLLSHLADGVEQVPTYAQRIDAMTAKAHGKVTERLHEAFFVAVSEVVGHSEWPGDVDPLTSHRMDEAVKAVVRQLVENGTPE